MTFTSSHIKYFNHAKDISKLSDFRGNRRNVKVGCIVVCGNKILSVGYNTSRTHPLQAHYNKYRSFANDAKIYHSLHAEIAALSSIKDMDLNWNKVDIYIYRSCKSRKCGLALPCDACMTMIKELGIKNIYYTTDDENITYGFGYLRLT